MSETSSGTDATFTRSQRDKIPAVGWVQAHHQSFETKPISRGTESSNPVPSSEESDKLKPESSGVGGTMPRCACPQAQLHCGRPYQPAPRSHSEEHPPRC